jgi:TPR repeat protein
MNNKKPKTTPKEPLTVDYLTELAEQGDAEAQFFLGAMLMHNFGQNVPQNPAAAAEGFRNAATEAAKWYRRAAEQGHTDAQFHLGLLYHTGYDIDKDLVEAHAWMTLAGILLFGSGKAQEISRAKEHIGRYEREMSPEQIAKAKVLADERIRKLIKKAGKGIRQPDAFPAP